MPELPDVTLYLEALEPRIHGMVLEGIRFPSPFFLRTVSPDPAELAGRRVVSLQRVGKRIVIGLEGELFAVIHLMIAGRLHWKPSRATIGGKNSLAAFDFDGGTLVVTEAGSKKRASLQILLGFDSLAALDRGGIEPLECDLATFRETLARENHTLKRALTDPRLFSGIGNAYSDEILHRARLSPVKLTSRLSDEEIGRLYHATRHTLQEWIERLRSRLGDRFPEKVTAFRPEMAVHGRYGEPCPDCGSPVQRIVHAENETNYCARCQTAGRLLADRSLSRLLHDDWPRSLEELEELRRR